MKEVRLSELINELIKIQESIEENIDPIVDTEDTDSYCAKVTYVDYGKNPNGNNRVVISSW